jgi:hypothetical protein
VHWWFDWDGKTFWSLTLQEDHEPTAMCVVQSTAVEASGVILGGRDGFLRTYNNSANDDCGVAFSAYVVMGPMAYTPDEVMGSVVTIDCTMGAASGNATWALLTAYTVEGVSAATPAATGTFTKGLNYTVRPSCKGIAFSMKLTSVAHQGFVFEDMQVVTRRAGTRRLS